MSFGTDEIGTDEIGTDEIGTDELWLIQGLVKMRYAGVEVAPEKAVLTYPGNSLISLITVSCQQHASISRWLDSFDRAVVLLQTVPSA